MLEREVEIIIARLADRTIGTQTHFTLSQVLTSDIPNGIKSYFQSEVMRWLLQDLDPSLHFARVNMTAPPVHRAREAFLRVCASEYMFPRNEFLATLENSVHFLTNYLCRPQWTLTEFVFGKETTLSREQLLSKLEYLDDYLHYKTLIKGILERKGWAGIDGDQFRSLLGKIDRHYIQQHAGRELAELIEPVFHFLSLAGPSPTGRIPVKPVLVFFSDKSEHGLKEYIENTCRIRNAAEISLAELRDILEDMPALPATTAEPVHEVPLEQPITATAYSEERPQAPAPAEVTGHIPQSSSETSRSLALSLTFAGLSVKPTDPPLPELQTIVSSDLRDLFINELFGSDASYYEAIITTLNATPHWKEASLYLNEFYEINNLNPQTDEAMQFTETIRQRYATERQNQK